MLHTLQIRLFGVPEIRLNDQPVEGFVTRKALALFIYLATNRRLHARDKLASLFWGDSSEQQAKNNLRRVLPNLRQLVGSHLVIDRQAVLFDEHQPFVSDVDVLRTALAGLPATLPLGQEGVPGVDPSHLEKALALYQGDFLDGFYVDDAPAFEEWATLQREELRELARRGLTLLTAYYLAHNNERAVLSATQRLLQLDPWSETAHYQQMLRLARNGQRLDALTQYENYRAALGAEFHLPPPPP